MGLCPFPVWGRLASLLTVLCGWCCGSECEQARLGLDEDLAGDETFESDA